MSLQKKPVFKSGNILTHEMLEVLADYAINAEELKYAGYSDGVIKGCSITTSSGSILVDKGIVMVKSKLFYLQKEVVVPVLASNDLQLLVIRATEEEESFDFIEREVKVLLVPEANLLPKDIELCRFRLQAGAELRSKYRDYQDLSTEYDTVCVKYAKWSAYEKESISPIILKKFREEALACNIKDAEDKEFLMRIAATTGSTLNASEINMYLSWRLNQPYIYRSNEEMYKDLLEVLRLIKGQRASSVERRTERRRMIVD